MGVIQKVAQSLTQVLRADPPSPNGNGHHEPVGQGGVTVAEKPRRTNECPEPSLRFPALRAVASDAQIPAEYAAAAEHIANCARCQRDVGKMRAVGMHFIDSSMRPKPVDSD